MKRKFTFKLQPLSDRRSERGVALLISLGFLSLLLVAALAFAANAIVARKSAANNRSRSQAIMLARSAVNNIMAAMKSEARTAQGLNPPIEYLVSRDNSVSHNDMITGNDTLLKAWVLTREYKPQDSLDEDNQPQWHYVKDDDDDAIIGRVAYYPLPHHGQINLSQVLRGYNNTNFARRWDSRFGADIRELNFDSSWGSNLASVASGLSSGEGAFRADEEDTTNTNNDLKDMDTALAGLNVTDTNDKNWLRQWFAAAGYNEPEVFAYDPDFEAHNRNADDADHELSPQTKYYHRFDLTNPKLKTGEVTIKDLFAEPDEYDPKNDSGEKRSTALPFIKMISNNKDSFTTLTRKRAQIAANFLDYCDENNEATWGLDDFLNPKRDYATYTVAGWLGAVPVFTGNERTPYINEVALFFNVEFQRDANGNIYDGSITLNPQVELVNIYGNDAAGVNVPDGMEVSVRITQLQVTIGTTTFKRTTTTYTKSGVKGTMNYTGGDGTRNVTYETIDLGNLTIFGLQGNDHTKLGNKQVKIKGQVQVMLRVKDGSTYVNADFSRNLSVKDHDTGASTLLFTEDNPGLVGWMVNDPRQNLNNSDGKYFSGTGSMTTLLDKTTLDDENDRQIVVNGKTVTVRTDGSSGDKEDLTALSTAFIANRPMVSPMELGAIHRGKAWETFNIGKANDEKYTHPKYNLATGVSEGSSGTSYSNGDGGILNQVKMTHDIHSPGKVNLNQSNDFSSRKYDLFSMLFKNVGVINAGYNMMDDQGQLQNGGDLLSASKTMAEEIYRYVESSDTFKKPYMSRAQLLDKTMHNDKEFFDGFGGVSGISTKAERDAMAGKIVCLTTTRGETYDTYQFVIVAQSIKDIGVGNISKSDGNGNIKSKDTAIGTFDRDGDVYFDEITGEVKMLATVKYDKNTQKVTLQSLEYLED